MFISINIDVVYSFVIKCVGLFKFENTERCWLHAPIRDLERIVHLVESFVL